MITRTPVQTFNVASKTWPTGPSVFGPATIPANISLVDAKFVDPAWSTDSAGLIGSFDIEFSTDGGATWGPLAKVTFDGGAANPPGIGTGVQPGWQIRATMTLSQSVTAAAQINLYT